MKKEVINLENLSKSYKIGHKNTNESYTALRDVLANPLRKTWSKIKNPQIVSHDIIEEFWALKDIDLKIFEGDRIGIIGKNGAGKTTMLKVLSRITPPTRGIAKIRGRIASLLEVGTGFHPELNGRENIFLNGSILGMSNKEIRSKFDEIVDFAGVEQFLDTPVKRYSTGMHVRLGFSVAAHLEPEILIVDEVLAVGDASFQKKCINKMNSVSKQGRTILFVSHQMQSIIKLCNRCILLENGQLLSDGSPRKIVDQYLESGGLFSQISEKLEERRNRKGKGNFKWIDTWIENNNFKTIPATLSGDDFYIVGKFKINNYQGPINLKFAFALYNEKSEQLTDLSNHSVNEEIKILKNTKNEYLVKCKIKKNPLAGGAYKYNVMLRNLDEVEDFIEDANTFIVEDGDFFNTGKSIEKGQGSILINQSWKLH